MIAEHPVDMLRFATAGSVDDGKSSLIGRLLYDSKSIMEDQMRAVETASRQRGNEGVELALLTDGLRAEREQNITIDVAYRYFSTAKRKFIIADTPGHLQYTRNMVTGTSTADLSVILIDARKGVLTQSKRHAAISSLLGIQQLVVAVNKMDLMSFSEMVFHRIVEEFQEFTDRLEVPNVHFIPISALLGDNVVERSENMDWYDAPPLLEFLESVEVPRRARSGFRLPVQSVVRPHQDFRGFAGRVESGTVAVGDLVEIAASQISSRVASIHVAGTPATQASEGQAALITIEDEVDASRGDLLVSPEERPTKADRFEAVVCWLHESPLKVGRRYLLLHTTRRVSAVVESVLHRIDVDTLEPKPAAELAVNDIGKLVLRTASPLFFDAYRENPSTGSFVLVDSGTNATVGAGMIQGERGAASGARPMGALLALAGTDEEAQNLGEALRGFGRPVLVLDGGRRELALEAAAQGFDVLFAGVPEGVNVFVVHGQAALERALSYLEGETNE
jgi:bifunctional enzyme CysN/CysC